MTNYREILRLKGLGTSERNIAASLSVSRNTVSKVCKKAEEMGIHWPLDNCRFRSNGTAIPDERRSRSALIGA